MIPSSARRENAQHWRDWIDGQRWVVPFTHFGSGFSVGSTPASQALQTRTKGRIEEHVRLAPFQVVRGSRRKCVPLVWLIARNLASTFFP